MTQTKAVPSAPVQVPVPPVEPTPVVMPPVVPMPPVTQASFAVQVPVTPRNDDPFAVPAVQTVPTVTPPVATVIVETKSASALPHVDSTRADPLNMPPELLKPKPTKSEVVKKDTTTVVKKDSTVTLIPTKTADGKAVTTIPTKTVETMHAPILPMGFGSVHGARVAGVEVAAEAQQPHSEEVVEKITGPRYSLFPAILGSHRNKVDGPGNAFGDGGIPPEILARGGGYNMPPPGVSMPPFDAGIAPGWANAFTPKGTTRPIPADFGPVQYPTNAFEDVLAHAMTPPYWAPPAPVAFHPTMAVPPTTPVEVSRINTGTTSAPLPLVMVTLKEALYPSQREEAAEKLGFSVDMKKRPEVVACLVDAAQVDPAANVRAACVRSLIRLEANTPEVVAVLRNLRSDRDAVVRKEVEKVRLPAAAAPVSVQDNAIQPVSAKGIVSPIK